MPAKRHHAGRRRTALALLGCGLLAPLEASRAQRAAGLRRVGVLAPSTAARESVTLQPFFEQMRQLGWVEGSTVSYDRVFADDQHQALARLARELVARGPEVIFAPPMPSAIAAYGATKQIPIVFATGVDPVGAGLVKSLSKPGGNVTGTVSVIESLAPKSLEFLLQVLPGAKRIALLGDPTDFRTRQDRDILTALLAARRITLVAAEASSAETMDAALARLLQERVDAVMTNSSLAFNLRDQVIARLRSHPIVVVGHRGELADSGALFSYGASLQDQIRRSANVVDKILKGAHPQDVPVEQPTTFELVINLRTARSMGITIPPAVLVRADRVVD